MTRIAALFLLLCVFLPLRSSRAEPPKADEPEPKWEKIVIRGETYYRMPEEVAKKLGLPRRDIPDEKNAATYYLRAVEHWVTFNGDYDALLRLVRVPWRGEDNPKVAAWVDDNSAALALIEKGLALRDCQFPVLMEEEGNTLLAVRAQPYLTWVRGFALAMLVQASALEAQSKANEGIERCFAVMRLGNHTAEEGALINWLVGVALNSMGADSLRQRVCRLSLRPERLRRLLGELALLARDQPDLSMALRGEKLEALNSAAFLLGGEAHDPTAVGKGYPEYVPAFMAGRVWRVLMPDRTLKRDMAKIYDVHIAAARKAPWQARLEMEDPIGMMKPYNVLGGILIPILELLGEELAHAQCQHEGALLAVALRLYRAERGKYPDNLQALAPRYLKRVPPDPFTGKPYHYALDDGHFILYSVGANLKDDGAEATDDGKKDDIAFTSRLDTGEKRP